MILFFIILIILIYIMFSSAIESASKKKATETDAPKKSIAYKPPEITYHIIDQNVGLHQSANDFINQPKIPEPEESKPKRKPFRPTLGERLEFWIDGAGYDTSNESGIPTNCGTSCSH